MPTEIDWDSVTPIDEPQEIDWNSVKPVNPSSDALRQRLKFNLENDYQPDQGNLFDQAVLGAGEGFSSIPGQVGGVMSFAARPFGNSTAGQSLQDYSRAKQAEYEDYGDTLGVSPWAQVTRNLTGQVAQQAPALAAGLLSGGSLNVMAGISGLQSLGQIQDEATNAYEAQGLSRSEATKKAMLPAAIGGIITTALTKIMPGGLETLTRDLVTGQITKGGVYGVIRHAVGEAFKEYPEEALDQLSQGIVSRYTYDPQKPWGEILKEANDAGAMGIFISGGVGALGAGVNAFRGGDDGGDGSVPPIRAIPPTYGPSVPMQSRFDAESQALRAERIRSIQDQAAENRRKIAAGEWTAPPSTLPYARPTGQIGIRDLTNGIVPENAFGSVTAEEDAAFNRVNQFDEQPPDEGGGTPATAPRIRVGPSAVIAPPVVATPAPTETVQPTVKESLPVQTPEAAPAVSVERGLIAPQGDFGFGDDQFALAPETAPDNERLAAEQAQRDADKAASDANQLPLPTAPVVAATPAPSNFLQNAQTDYDNAVMTAKVAKQTLDLQTKAFKSKAISNKEFIRAKQENIDAQKKLERAAKKLESAKESEGKPAKRSTKKPWTGPPDIVSELEGNRVKMRRLKPGETSDTEAEHRAAQSAFPDLFTDSPTASSPDQALMGSARTEKLSVGEFLQSIADAKLGRESYTKALKQQVEDNRIGERESKQSQRFQEDAIEREDTKKKKTDTVDIRDLSQGERMNIRGVRMDVSRVLTDPNDETIVKAVELKDGDELGTQIVDAEQAIKIDKRSLRNPDGTRKTKSQGTDFLPDDIKASLDWEEIEPGVVQRVYRGTGMVEIRDIINQSRLSETHKKALMTALDALDKSGLDTERLRLEIRAFLEGGYGGSASVDALGAIIHLSESASADVGPHEVFHLLIHSLKTELRAQLEAERIANMPANAPAEVRSGTMSSRDFHASALPKELYPFINLDEYAAHVFGTRAALEAATKKNPTLWGKIKEAFAALWKALRDLSKDPVASDVIYKSMLNGEDIYDADRAKTMAMEQRASLKTTNRGVLGEIATAEDAAAKVIIGQEAIGMTEMPVAALKGAIANAFQGIAFDKIPNAIKRILRFNDFANMLATGEKNAGGPSNLKAISAAIHPDLKGPLVSAAAQFALHAERIWNDAIVIGNQARAALSSKPMLNRINKVNALKILAISKEAIEINTKAALKTLLYDAQLELKRANRTDTDIARLQGEIKGITAAEQSSVAMERLLNDITTVLMTSPEGRQALQTGTAREITEIYKDITQAGREAFDTGEGTPTVNPLGYSSATPLNLSRLTNAVKVSGAEAASKALGGKFGAAMNKTMDSIVSILNSSEAGRAALKNGTAQEIAAIYSDIVRSTTQRDARTEKLPTPPNAKLVRVASIMLAKNAKLQNTILTGGPRESIASIYRDIVETSKNSVQDDNLINVASALINKNVELRDALLTKMYGKDQRAMLIATGKLGDLVELLQKNPSGIIGRMMNERAKRASDATGAEFLYRMMEKEVAKELESLLLKVQAGNVAQAVRNSPDWIKYREELLVQQGSTNGKPIEGFRNSNAMMQLPDKTWIEIGSNRIVDSTTQTAAALKQFSRGIEVLKAWTNDPANWGHVDYRRAMLDLQTLELLYSASLIQSGKHSAVLTNALSIMNLAVDNSNSRHAPRVRAVLGRYDRLFVRALEWLKPATFKLSRTTIAAWKSHGFGKMESNQASTTYDSQVFQPLAANAQFRKHPPKVGDKLITGEVVTAEDLIHLEEQSKESRKLREVVKKLFRDLIADTRGLQATKLTTAGVNYRETVEGSRFMVPREARTDLALDPRMKAVAEAHANYMYGTMVPVIDPTTGKVVLGEDGNPKFARDIKQARNPAQFAALNAAMSSIWGEHGSRFIDERNHEFAHATMFDGVGGAFQTVADEIRNSPNIYNDLDSAVARLASFSGKTEDESRAVLLGEFGRIVNQWHDAVSKDEAARTTSGGEPVNSFTRARGGMMAPSSFYQTGFSSTEDMTGYMGQALSAAKHEVVKGFEEIKDDLIRQMQEKDRAIKLKGESKALSDKGMEVRNGEAYSDWTELQTRLNNVNNALTSLNNDPKVRGEWEKAIARNVNGMVGSLIGNTLTTLRNLSFIYVVRAMWRTGHGPWASILGGFGFNTAQSAQVIFHGGLSLGLIGPFRLAQGVVEAGRAAIKDGNLNDTWRLMFRGLIKEFGTDMPGRINGLKELVDAGIYEPPDAQAAFDHRLANGLAGALRQGNIPKPGESGKMTTGQKALVTLPTLFENSVGAIVNAAFPLWGDVGINTTMQVIANSAIGHNATYGKKLRALFNTMRPSRFDLDNPNAAQNIISHKELGISNRQLGGLRDLFQTMGQSFDAKAVDFYKRLQADPNAQFLSQAETDKVTESLINIANRGVVGNRPNYFKGSALTETYIAPLLQWPTRQLAEVLSSIHIPSEGNDKVANAKELSRAKMAAWGMTMAILALNLGVGALSQLRDEEAARALRLALYKQISQNRQPWQEETAGDQAKAWTRMGLESVPLISMIANMALPQNSPSRSAFDPSLVVVEKAKNVGVIFQNLIATGDFGKAGMDTAKGFLPADTKIVINRMDSQAGQNVMRNTAALMKQFGPKDLVRVSRFGNTANPNLTALSHYGPDMWNATFNGKTDDVVTIAKEALDAVAQSEKEKSPNDYQNKAYAKVKNMFLNGNPVHSAFSQIPSKSQFDEMVAKMSDGQKAQFEGAMRDYTAAGIATGFLGRNPDGSPPHPFWKVDEKPFNPMRQNQPRQIGVRELRAR